MLKCVLALSHSFLLFLQQKAIKQWKAWYEVWSYVALIKEYVTGGKRLGGKRSHTATAEAGVLVYVLNWG